MKAFTCSRRGGVMILLLLAGLLTACGATIQADRTGRAQIDDVSIQILESFPVQVEILVRGNLPDSCTEIDQVSQRFDAEDNTFWVELTTVRTQEDACAQALVPFEENVSLDVYGLAAGSYRVDVNGTSKTFELDVDNAPSDADMPNPASVYCEEQGYRVEIRTDDEGNQYGVCIFPDGSECGDWAFYRGECGPAAEMANPASVYCEEQGYRVEIRTDDEGNEYGVCVFPDGGECDEWEFFRGDCGPAQ